MKLNLVASKFNQNNIFFNSKDSKYALIFTLAPVVVDLLEIL